jgi:hypothetical protein
MLGFAFQSNSRVQSSLVMSAGAIVPLGLNRPVGLYRRSSHPVMDRLMGESVSALTGVGPDKDD